MKNQIPKLALAIALAGTALLGPARAQMAPAKPGPEMEKLKFLVGHWTYTDTYEKSSFYPEGGVGTGVYDARPGPGGFSLILDFSEHTPMGEEIGHGILTWDPKENAYREYFAGNDFPGVYASTGHWEGETFVLMGELDLGGAKTTFRDVYSDITAHSVTIQEFAELPGKPMQLTGTSKATK